MYDQFKIIDIGEWFTEYRCKKCNKEFVLNTEDDDPERHHKCEEA